MTRRLSIFYNVAACFFLSASIAVIVLSHLGFITLGAQQTQTRETLKVVQAALNQYLSDHEHYPLSQEITGMETLETFLSAYVQREFFIQSSLEFVSYQSDGNSFALQLSKEKQTWILTADHVSVR